MYVFFSDEKRMQMERGCRQEKDRQTGASNSGEEGKVFSQEYKGKQEIKRCSGRYSSPSS